MKLSIIIPAYNEEQTVEILLERVETALAKLGDLLSSHEIIIVNDGSSDRTRQILDETFGKKREYQIHHQEKNCGKGAAIRKGVQLASGDMILIQDSDLEYDPNDYRALLRPIIDRKADVVYGSRFRGEVQRVLYFWHSMGNRLLTLLSNMFTNLNLTDMETCYKVFRTPILKNMILECNRFGIEPEMTAKMCKVSGIRVFEVPISYYGRTYEEGKKINWKDGVAAIWFIVKFNLFVSVRSAFKVDLYAKKDNRTMGEVLLSDSSK